jgi:hypothetical protein
MIWLVWSAAQRWGDQDPKRAGYGLTAVGLKLRSHRWFEHSLDEYFSSSVLNLGECSQLSVMVDMYGLLANRNGKLAYPKWAPDLVL